MSRSVEHPQNKILFKAEIQVLNNLKIFWAEDFLPKELLRSAETGDSFHTHDSYSLLKATIAQTYYSLLIYSILCLDYRQSPCVWSVAMKTYFNKYINVNLPFILQQELLSDLDIEGK